MSLMDIMKKSTLIVLLIVAIMVWAIAIVIDGRCTRGSLLRSTGTNNYMYSLEVAYTGKHGRGLFITDFRAVPRSGDNVMMTIEQHPDPLWYRVTAVTFYANDDRIQVQLEER